jgi:superfamily II DNA/RNA helicase
MPAESSAAPEHDVTTPLTTFAALGVPAPLVEVLDEQGIAAPFPVQAATLPDALAGRDILGRARTGSGKTLGFALPLVSRLAGGSTLTARPRGLILVPTRELANQVAAVLQPLARAMNLWVTTIYGGVSYGPQVNALQRKTDIVVATPGRLADLIGQGKCDLSDVEITVIDEADQMADLGFLPIVRRLLETTPADGQRMLFSATLDAAIDVLARRFLHHPVLHSVDENSSPAEIEHHVLTVDAANRVAVIAALAGGEKRSLVFTRTKHGAERLARQLTAAGIPAAELHGNLRQGARTKNLAAFTSGLARVMVATDIAARGIHIDGIDLVIHFDPPVEHKAYVHRSGRTARGGADGVVVTLQTRAQARDVTAMMRKADITPHAPVAVDTDSDVIAEIAGPPAPRVTVSGKVSELVRPEDRLARNDGPGTGSSGRPRRDRGRERKPRDDRFRDRGPRAFAPRDRDGSGNGRGSARSGPRPAAETSTGRGDAAREQRPSGGGRPAGADRDRSQRFSGDGRPARFDRGDRLNQGNRNERFQPGDRGSGDRGSGDRGDSGRSYGDRQGRGDNPGDRGGNDWWPRAAVPGRSAGQPGYRRPGSSGRPFSAGNQGDGRSRAARDGWNRDDRGRDDRGRDDRGPDTGGRSQAGGQQFGPRTGRTDRPQASGHPGGSTGRAGYSASRGAAGKRRDPGQGRHF